jgi:hypothetical protein
MDEEDGEEQPGRASVSGLTSLLAELTEEGELSHLQFGWPRGWCHLTGQGIREREREREEKDFFFGT